jgi:uncharacterized repeat protein (TIGR03803 family)
MQTRNVIPVVWSGLIVFAAVQALFVAGGLKAAETNLLLIKSFGNPEQAISQPNGRLTEGSDGKLYGASWAGGQYGLGAVFRLNKDGTGFQILHHFSGPDGYHVSGGMIEGTDGKLFGTTAETQGGGSGAIFAVEKDGTGFQLLHRFAFGTNDGTYPRSGVIQGSDGLLYGRTQYGGAFGGGCVYRIATDGSGYRLIASLRAAGASGLTEGSDGYLYGTTSGNGAVAGTLFRVDKAGSEFTLIRSFDFETNGAPDGPLVVMADGTVYGTAWLNNTTNGGCIYRVRADGSGYAVLKEFVATTTEGRVPRGLTLAGNGSLYGSLLEVQPVLGPGGWTRTHFGALFRVDTNGQNFALLHSFTSTNGAFLSFYLDPLMQASDGFLYGITPAGGEATSYDRGWGTAYRIHLDGSDFETIQFFDVTGGEGTLPGKLIQGRDGNLYGITSDGGRSNDTGVVYQLNTNGTGYSQLFSFSTVAAHTPTDLIEGRDGFLYATTLWGGGAGGRGVVVRIPKDGSSGEVLRVFAGLSEGSNPQAIVHAADGRLYVTVANEGPFHANGFVFSMRTDGSDYRVVRAFSLSDGSPRRLIEGSDGWLYGTTVSGSGSLFRLHPTGNQFSLLHDGVNHTTIFEGKDGLLYGATSSGGSGTLFKISKNGENYARFLDLPGTNQINVVDLVEGADSLLYGIGSGMMFRVERNGERFAVLSRFTGTNRGPTLPQSLVAATDLAMYLATYSGGEMNMGTILKFVPPPDIQISVLPDLMRVSALGLPTRSLRIEASPDLANWTTLGPTSVTGRLSVDQKAPSGTRFYRAVVE